MQRYDIKNIISDFSFIFLWNWSHVICYRDSMLKETWVNIYTEAQTYIPWKTQEKALRQSWRKTREERRPSWKRHREGGKGGLRALGLVALGGHVSVAFAAEFSVAGMILYFRHFSLPFKKDKRKNFDMDIWFNFNKCR